MEPTNDLYKTLRIQSIAEETKGFKVFTFDEGHGIRYEPGQYLTFVKFEYGQEVRRSYSLISTPVLNEPLSVGVKRVENGLFSRLLVDGAKPGDELTTIGNGGFFTLPEDMALYRQVFFFAAGSGITPVYSLLKTVLHVYPAVTAVLIYSNPSPEKAAFLSPLQSLAQQFQDRFHLELLFSNAPDLSRARLTRDLITSFLGRFMTAEKERTIFFVCGPENYMRLCTYGLGEQGVNSRNIKRENFYFAEVARRDASPPLKGDYRVSIRTGERIYRFEVRYPDSILKAAKKEGIVLPYSCEAGRCGNCVARCIQGNVWHSYNEVLTEEELSKGMILTCVGHPNGGDVELEI